jgi:hypothetical protein
LTTRRFDPDAFDPIDGCSLATYAEVCRALVRVPGGSTRHLERALAEHAMTPATWTAIRAAWSDRIAHDPRVRDAFRRLYTKEGDIR